MRQAARSPRQATALQAALVALVACVAFSGTLGHEFVWDDNSLLAHVEGTVREGGLGALLRAEFLLRPGEPLGYYRPVVLLSLWTDSRLAAWFPGAHHATNVALHAIVSILVFCLLRRALSTTAFAVAGALLFATHPVHTEAVAFVSGRTDLWAAVFVLLSALLWVRARASGVGPRIAVIGGSLAALLAGILSKEVSLMLPAVLLVWDLLQPGEGAGWWARNRIWIVGWCVVLAVAAILRWGIAEVPPWVPTGQEDGLIAHRSLVPAALALYLRLLVIPWPLSAYYGVDDLASGWLSWITAAALVAVCAGLAARRHGNAGLLGLTWILLFLVPVLGAVPIRSALLAERFLYLPSVGAVLVAAALLAWAAARLGSRAIPWVACLLMIAAFGYGTVVRSAVWRDAESLFADLERTSPTYVARGRNNLAVRMQSLGRHEEAARLFREALELQPRSAETRSNLGTSLLALGKPGEAEEQYRQALALQPGFPEPRLGLGMALLGQGRLAEAQAECALLERSSPGLAAALRHQIEAAAQQEQREDVLPPGNRAGPS